MDIFETNFRCLSSKMEGKFIETIYGESYFNRIGCPFNDKES